MNGLPLVSIICLCYNHEKFLEEALLSVLHQDYPNKEIIVVDDFSSDASVEKIKKIIQQYPEVIFIPNQNNIGNCRSFNQAFERSKGAYIIDFATDDVMLPGKIKKQVEKFLTLSEKYGVVYSDAENITETGTHLGYHHKGTKREGLHPEGDIFKELVRKYFICPPTMMIKRTVLEKSGGYNVALSYEDFYFWVTSGRDFYYAFMPEVLMKRRVVVNSLSMSFFTKKNIKIFESTLTVLNTTYDLCRNEEEVLVLSQRVRFEMKHAFFMEVFSVMEGYKELLIKVNAYDKACRVIYFLAKKKIRLFWLYKFVIRYKGFYSIR